MINDDTTVPGLLDKDGSPFPHDKQIKVLSDVIMMLNGKNKALILQQKTVLVTREMLGERIMLNEKETACSMIKCELEIQKNTLLEKELSIERERSAKLREVNDLLMEKFDKIETNFVLLIDDRFYGIENEAFPRNRTKPLPIKKHRPPQITCPPLNDDWTPKIVVKTKK